ncbi:hypothetical protein AYI70_g11838 [Smittium culicis]|uniref:Uncharacterized protein n=1 Tax=Smittium culicis TaxID=133412 RepID=A0A1R1X075_9FUNG|nr:hypothetical protein AYI70_g11838 [Smittium culicis]
MINSDSLSKESYSYYVLRFWEILSLIFALSFYSISCIFQSNPIEPIWCKWFFILNSAILLVITGSINTYPIKKRISNRPDDPTFEGTVYTENEVLLDSPEASCSFWGSIFFLWMSDLMNEAKRIHLSYTDLYSLSKFEFPGGPFFLSKIVNELENVGPDFDPTIAYIYCIGLLISGLAGIFLENQSLWKSRLKL